MAKFYVYSFLLLIGNYGIASTMKLDFIDNKFEDFIERLSLSQTEKNEFSSYYGSICTKLKESEEVKKRLAEGYLYKIALEGMEKKHPAWYQALQPFISDPRITLDTEINTVRMFIGGFLIRYGAYEEFLTVKKGSKKEESFLGTAFQSMKGYFISAKNRVFSWFALS